MNEDGQAKDARDGAYRPVSCDVYDALEAAVVLGRPVMLETVGPDGLSAARRVRIKDVYARDGIEFALLEDGTAARLDRLRPASG